MIYPRGIAPRLPPAPVRLCIPDMSEPPAPRRSADLTRRADRVGFTEVDGRRVRRASRRGASPAKPLRGRRSAQTAPRILPKRRSICARSPQPTPRASCRRSRRMADVLNTSYNLYDHLLTRHLACASLRRTEQQGNRAMTPNEIKKKLGSGLLSFPVTAFAMRFWCCYSLFYWVKK